jgi:hypothetical protein
VVPSGGCYCEVGPAVVLALILNPIRLRRKYIVASSRRFRVNSPAVIHETIDGEVVIINLNTGNYYSLDRIGATVWELLDKGHSIDEIVEVAAGRYDGSPVDMENGISQLVSELQQEDLVLSDDAIQPAPYSSAPSTEKQRFEAPSLLKYTDMQDLILLDPIHEVDETGWPRRKADAPA